MTSRVVIGRLKAIEAPVPPSSQSEAKITNFNSHLRTDGAQTAVAPLQVHTHTSPRIDSFILPK